MVRSCFALAAVAALAVLFVATDSSDAARQRRRGRNRNNGAQEYSSFYRQDIPPNAVALNVQVPVSSAQIFFDGQPTTQTGMARSYVSPPLTPGKTYTYQLKATWMQNGEKVTRTRTVEVFPGQMVMVDLTREQGTKPMPKTSRETR